MSDILKAFIEREEVERLSKGCCELTSYRMRMRNYRILLKNLVRCKETLRLLSVEKEMSDSIDAFLLHVELQFNRAVQEYNKKLVYVSTSKKTNAQQEVL